jgi:hypothetical protein
MSSTRYMEFDSSYRNRVDWPLPGYFEMPISQTGRKDKTNAVDPVCLSTPSTAWTSNLVDASLSGVQVAGVIDSIAGTDNIAAMNSKTVFIITSGVGNLQTATNYYRGMMFKDTTTTPDENRRIVAYLYLGTDDVSAPTVDRAILTISPALSDDAVNGDAWTINDPTDISNTIFPAFYVPSGEIQQNAYVTKLLYNETRDQSRRIIDYGITSHLLAVDTLESATSTSTEGPVTTWTATDNYSIRQQRPGISLTISSATTSTINLPVGLGASTENNFYNNDFIRIRPVTYGATIAAPQGSTRRIINYTGEDGVTEAVITVSPPFDAVPTGVMEILPFSYDNLYPFAYSGSTVSQSEMVCYEIELLNLVLPNNTLAVANGGSIPFYPYVYVEVSNVSAAGAGIKNVIYSNNPNATSAVFRAAVDDIPNPIISSYIKIDGDGMVQTLKFKPNDNIRIKITMSCGTVFDTTYVENYSPLPPNHSSQISGVISMRRL